jgi:hypothetical protein
MNERGQKVHSHIDETQNKNTVDDCSSSPSGVSSRPIIFFIDYREAKPIMGLLGLATEECFSKDNHKTKFTIFPLVFGLSR